MIPMKAIRDLVQSWQSEALKNSKAQFAEKTKQQIEEFLNDNEEVKETLRIAQNHRDALCDALEQLRDMVPKSLYILQGQEDIKKALFNDYYSHEYFSFLEDIKADQQQHEFNIKREYTKLNELITGCRSGVKAKQMLENMGLDVSSLNEGKNYLVALDNTPLNVVLLGVPVKTEVKKN